MSANPLPSSESFRDAFAQAGATQPVVLWRPAERDYRDPLILRFARLCEGLRDANGAIPLARFVSAYLGALADYIAVAEPCKNSPDFRFLTFGRNPFATRGRDLTDRTTAVLDPHIRLFLRSLSSASLQSGYWVLGTHEPMRKVFARDRTSLIVPLTGADSPPERLAVMTVNQNPLSPGLDALPDPALVIQPDLRVVYANGQAEAIYGQRMFMAEEVFLSEYCGFDLGFVPDDAPDSDWLREVQAKSVRNGLIVTSQVTLRKVVFRRQTFVIVIIRPG